MSSTDISSEGGKKVAAGVRPLTPAVALQYCFSATIVAACWAFTSGACDVGRPLVIYFIVIYTRTEGHTKNSVPNINECVCISIDLQTHCV